MPTPKLRFQEQKNHQNLEYSIIFRNALVNISQFLRNKFGYQILWGKHRAIYTMYLPYWFHTAEKAVCRSCSTVHQSNHFTTVLRTSEFMQVSPFSSTVVKGHFSWYVFLNVWTYLLFAGDVFCGCDVLFQKIQQSYFCFVSFVHVQSTSKSKSAYFCLSCMRNMSNSGFGKFRHKSFGYSLEKSERPCFFSSFFSTNKRIQNFWEAIRISGTPYWFPWFSETNTIQL